MADGASRSFLPTRMSVGTRPRRGSDEQRGTAWRPHCPGGGQRGGVVADADHALCVPNLRALLQGVISGVLLTTPWSLTRPCAQHHNTVPWHQYQPDEQGAT